MPYINKEIKQQYFKNYYKKNKEFLSKYRKKYRKENKEKEKEWQDIYRDKSIEKRRNYTIKSRYNIDTNFFNLILSKQDNKCACCFKDFIKVPHIDHCHTTGKFRALLCGTCNTALGKYEIHKERLERYLTTHGKE